MGLESSPAPQRRNGFARRTVLKSVAATGVAIIGEGASLASIITKAHAAFSQHDARLPVVTAQMFGAAGDGSTNDTHAFRSAATFLLRAGGGTLELQPKTYIVGEQDQADSTNWAFHPRDILNFGAFTGTIMIKGNGATLRCAPGLKFGAFNPDSTPHNKLGTDLSKRASPYQGMIHAEAFTGTLEVENLTLDGNIQNLSIGGRWGDTGWQIKNAGLQLLNSGPVILRNVRSINHGTDGCTYYADVRDINVGRHVRLEVDNCAFDMNGRQGFSMVGGKGAVFRNSSFSNSGRNGAVDSNPHSGFDMEPEGGRICADVNFISCSFTQNNGAGYVSDVLEAARRITFHNCTFSGDYNFSHWIRPNEHTFHRCRIIGAWIDVSENDLKPNGRGSATRYIDCTFVGDPTQTPSGSIYGQGLGYIGGGPPSATPSFERCIFHYPAKNLKLPYMLEGVSVRDCQFHLAMPGLHPVAAQFYGTNVIRGLGQVKPIANHGRLIVNGIERHNDRPRQKG